MKSILSLAFLIAFALQFVYTDASGKTNERRPAQQQLVLQSPRVRLLRMLPTQQLLQAPQPIKQQQPIAQRPQQLRQQPIASAVKKQPAKQQRQLVQVQPQQRPVVQQQPTGQRRIKLVKVSQSPQKLSPLPIQPSKRPSKVQQTATSLPQSPQKSSAPKKTRPVQAKKAPLRQAAQQVNQNQLPSIDNENGSQPARKRPSQPAVVPTTSPSSNAPDGSSNEDNSSPSSNGINDNNNIGSSNGINANNEIDSSNRITASNSINASNRINANNEISSSNRISDANRISASNRITANNEISSANRINSNNLISSSNRISASNSIDASNSINSEEVSDCSVEGYFRDTKICDKFYQCARLGNMLKMFEFQCTGGLVFDLALKVCNYPQARENCDAFLYTGEVTDDGSYNESELIRASDNVESNLVENEADNSPSNNENTSELEAAQPPERSTGPVTEGSNVATNEDDESSW